MKTNLQTSLDPIISADLYREGLLDEGLSNAIVPVSEQLRAALGGNHKLWFIRSNSGGNHIKLRLHCDAEDLRHFSQVFSACTAGHFEAVTWIRFARTPVALATSWLNHDAYVRLAYDSLSTGSAMALRALATPVAQRETLLVRIALQTFNAIELHHSGRLPDYLTYHRDWLLRFVLRNPAKEQQALACFAAETQRRAATVSRIRNILEVPASAGGSGPEAGWRSSLHELSLYLETFRNDPEFDVDEFAADSTFPPLFKVFHCLANQMGIPLLREAFAYHLMLAGVELDSNGDRP